MPSDTVMLDRQAVLDLLVEANKVGDVIEALTGTCPTILTEPLLQKATAIGEAILGPDGVQDLWKGDAAREFFHELAGGRDERGGSDA